MLSTELRKLSDVNAVTVPANFVKMLELVSGDRFAWDLVGKKLNLKSRKRSKAMKASIVKKLTCLVLALVASFSVFASATHCRTTEGAKWTIELSVYEDRIEYEVSRATSITNSLGR
ncbi:hypothetical protein EDB71_10495 [Vibrio crassostreae]|nr:hypothetical protein EDB71_10495 [Vibrio crassostreae]